MENMNQEMQTTLGGRIILARENANFTEKQLSYRLGVMPKTVRNWETDRSEPRGNKLAMLAGVLGISLGWLVSGEQSNSETLETFEETRPLQVKLDQMVALQEQTSALIFEIRSDILLLQRQLNQDET